jgi:hypothetical protein
MNDLWQAIFLAGQLVTSHPELIPRAFPGECIHIDRLIVVVVDDVNKYEVRRFKSTAKWCAPEDPDRYFAYLAKH